MGSTFSGIEIGKKSLIAHQTGLNVVGHNLANADNDAYSRQKINPVTFNPLYEASLNRPERAGQVGQGVEISEIRRARDIFLDQRIFAEVSNKEYWQSKNDILTQIEHVQDALGDVNLRTRLDVFWTKWEELSLNPSEPAVREDLLVASNSLTDALNTGFERINKLRKEFNEKVLSAINQVNNMASAIRDINVKILKSKTIGDNPNDLMDKRDAMVQKLAEIVNIRVNNKDDDEIMIFIGERMLIQGSEVNKLRHQGNPQNEGHARIYWEGNNDLLELKSGKLLSFIEARDVYLKDQINALDSISANLIVSVNEIHQKGFNNYKNTGIDFFNTVHMGIDPLGNYDSNGDNQIDSTYIFQIKGVNTLSPNQIIGENGTITLESKTGRTNVIYSNEDKISDVIDRINLAATNVNAYIDDQGLLVFKAKNSDSLPPFVIQHLEDSGNFLTNISGVLKQPGPAGSFNFRNINEYNKISGGAPSFERTPFLHPSSWISVNKTVKEDPNHIAASGGTDYDGDNINDKTHGIGDGSIAIKIAALRNNDIMIDSKSNLQDFYSSMINTIASENNHAQLETEKYDAIMRNLFNTRQSVSGVNIDEEMAHMITMQHGYSAAARIVVVMDKMLDTLMRMG